MNLNLKTDNEPFFIDLGYSQRFATGEDICGDAFKYQKGHDDGRVIAVLSDGLGSGVKANILASMTATMALKFTAEESEGIIHAAEIMMSALPICQVRKISYATFTIVNAGLGGSTRVIEMGNPQFLLFRQGKRQPVSFETMISPKWYDRAMKVYNFAVKPGDRLVFFSDGISQSGMGSKAWPLGWGENGCADYVVSLLEKTPDISSHELSEHVLTEARRKEPGMQNKDDMTCAALYFRHPRKLLLFTGPPFDRARDAECCRELAAFDGNKIVCGGTSAEIVSRELGLKLTLDLSDSSSELPPPAYMDGIDLVTEGILTLTKTAQYLESFDGRRHENAAGSLVDYFLRNDVIEFLVGTRINESHQDPNLPLDLEIRRNIVKRIASVLENRYLKRVSIKFV
ncbi:MAG: SpoIIE family protein phosphatase [Thermoguttaceae bacterium]|nr:SpoIIE family protein phosphatase [Thermoguttaceae bacterium]